MRSLRDVLTGLDLEGKRYCSAGSGDGRDGLLAQALGAHTTLMEWDGYYMDLARASTETLLGNGALLERPSFIEDNMLEQDFSSYDVVFYHA